MMGLRRPRYVWCPSTTRYGFPDSLMVTRLFVSATAKEKKWYRE